MGRSGEGVDLIFCRNRVDRVGQTFFSLVLTGLVRPFPRVDEIGPNICQMRQLLPKCLRVDRVGLNF